VHGSISPTTIAATATPAIIAVCDEAGDGGGDEDADGDARAGLAIVVASDGGVSRSGGDAAGVGGFAHMMPPETAGGTMTLEMDSRFWPFLGQAVTALTEAVLVGPVTMAPSGEATTSPSGADSVSTSPARLVRMEPSASATARW
jgi:hypothetical protein